MRYRHATLTMQPWEIQHAITIGGGRYIANLGKGNASHYDHKRMEHDLIAQPASVLCEAAVAKHLNVYYDWSLWTAGDHNKHRQQPDLIGIEVRRVRTKPLVTVRKTDVEKGVKVYAAWVNMTNPTKVFVYGYITAAEGWQRGIPADFSPNARRVALKHLTLEVAA
jgi:hypothetical protein